MRMRVLFLQEGVLAGGGVMGHATYQHSIRAELDRVPEVEATFRGLPPMGRSARRMSRGWPLLGGLDLDLQTVRWHAVQARRARQTLQMELMTSRPDVVHVKSHSIAMGLADHMDSVPIVPVVDVTVWEWREMAIWRGLRRHSRAMVGPSEMLERRVLSRAPMVIALTDWAKAAVLRCSPDANVVKHHPGIDLARYAPAEHETAGPRRVLFVGGRFEAKGGLDLLEALRPRLGRDVVLDVVTTDPVPDTDGVVVHRLDAGDPRLVELYRQADVFCLPTVGDSNPWVILEAMACATPVVSTSVGAIPELLGEGEAGLVVEPGDRDALGVALDTLLGDDLRRRRLGAAGRRRCERHYDSRVQVPLLFELLRQVALNSHSTAA
jgi:glycosyltransferase involved in cell wall biosynthesis